MENIVLFDDRSQTETTLILNKDEEVIGVEIYFSTPRQISTFFNQGIIFQNQRPRVVKSSASPISPILPKTEILENPSYEQKADPNVRFEVEVPEVTPCGGPRQRPCV